VKCSPKIGVSFEQRDLMLLEAGELILCVIACQFIS
jgi:hypothetical protein